MYQAKSEHGNNWRLHRAEFDSADVLTLEDDLRRAIASDDFDVRYQPVFRLDTGQLVEVEALLRWQHPRAGPSHHQPSSTSPNAATSWGPWGLGTRPRLCPGRPLARPAGRSGPASGGERLHPTARDR